MSSDDSSDQIRPPSQLEKPARLDVSEMLTPKELEELRQKNIEIDAVLQKAYPDVKILQ